MYVKKQTSLSSETEPFLSNFFLNPGFFYMASDAGKIHIPSEEKKKKNGIHCRLCPTRQKDGTYVFLSFSLFFSLWALCSKLMYYSFPACKNTSSGYVSPAADFLHKFPDMSYLLQIHKAKYCWISNASRKKCTRVELCTVSSKCLQKQGDIFFSLTLNFLYHPLILIKVN